MGAALRLREPPRTLTHGTEPSAEPMVSLSQVLSALSHALDLTEGQPPGHTIRTCVIGMRIAESLGLPAEDRSALYYALLLKDTGCSSNATRMAAIFGSDDRYVKRRMRVADWHAKARLAFTTAGTVGHGKSIFERVRHFVAVARSEKLTNELIGLRCERGATITERLGFPRASADAIRSLDEHWCGLGHACGLSGEAIPLLARICSIAQTIEVFHAAYGVDEAIRVVRRRGGTWFDPALVKVVTGWKNDVTWWRGLKTAQVDELVLALEPADQMVMADADRIDDVARAFADIIDAKSPYTYNHSVRVAAGAQFIAQQLGMDADAQRRIHRTGLLHDIGKLGVSSQILDKPGALTPAERAEVEEHPRYSYSILSRVAAFRPFAWTASVHHERLDGTGYPWRLPAEQLTDAARLLAVADVYDALVSDRPYRAGLQHDTAIDVLWDEAGTRLWAEAIRAIAEWN